MGYQMTRFTQEIDEEFQCSICGLILKDSMQSPCEHLFCNECIEGWLAADQSCPVERVSLKLEDMKPALRAFRNLINKLDIKCDYESKDCQELVKLRDLQDHVIRCKYNPNARVICDKGCNIEMRRHEYETKNCFRHLADQDVRLKNEVSLQDEKIEQLNDEVTSLRIQQEDYGDKIAMINEEMKKFSVNERPEFRLVRGNGTLSFDENVLEVQNRPGCVQTIKPLDQTNFSSKFEILSLGERLEISLAPKCVSGGWFDITAFYRSDGWSNFNGISEKLGSAWKVGDIIECGINFPSDFVNGSRDVRVYCNQNGKLIGRRPVTMPVDGFFPTVYLKGGPKIKYLSNQHSLRSMYLQ